MTTTNSNLNLARRTKNDEFYTRLEDVEAELVHYENHFRDKTVYLNCDDQDSAFWQYFSERFDDLGLRRLVATKYPEGVQFRQDRGEGLQVIQLEGDGDFRSDECVELLKQADIVVTNPPFSLFREYVVQLVEHGKKFVVMANKNAITYKEIWPLIQGNELWVGATSLNGGRWMILPDDLVVESKGAKEENGRRILNVPGVCWFTNLDHAKRHEELPLWKRYTPEEYPKYDNYDAINVNKVKEIPEDYDGAMGVPITFLDKHNPDQFEIWGCTESEGVGFSRGLWFSASKVTQPLVGGLRKYKRILIRRRRDATNTKQEGSNDK